MFCGVILTSWGEGASIYILGWPPLQWWRNNKSTLLGICFITLISHTTHIFLVGWLKFHLNCYFSWDWLREMNTGSSCYSCWCLSFFGLLRPDLSPWRYRNRRFLTALLFLIVNTPNLKVATKRHLHQWVKEQGYYECHATHRNVSLRVFPVVWIFRESLGVVCYDRWVLSENHKNYFKDWCLTNSKLTFLILTSSQVIEMVILSKRHILDTSGPRI